MAWLRARTLALLAAVVVLAAMSPSAAGAKKSLIETFGSEKEFKKLLRTRLNVLVVATDGNKADKLLKGLEEVASQVKGEGTIAHIDCSSGRDAAMACRKLKFKPSPFELKHYHKGSFNKDYDRKMSTKSIVKFMRDPTGDTPWDEVDEAKDVMHLTDKTFDAVAKKQDSMLVMFYAPWCGHCSRMKPDYQQAATEMKEMGIKGALAAIDATSPDSRATASRFEVQGFPTLLYFENGKQTIKYEGKREKNAILEFMKNPKEPPPPPPPEKHWSEEDNDVLHLDGTTFDTTLAGLDSALVMFYAPWCGHCKAFKGDFADAATTVKGDQETYQGSALAAVDCTAEASRDICSKYDVNGFPTIKHFRRGQVNKDYDRARKARDVLEFMKDPNAPPPPPPPPEPVWADSESAVLHLDGDNFESMLKKKKHALVMFYAPWCGHCKRAKPEFEAAADSQASNRKVAFAAVDCTGDANRALCEQNDVSGFPTLRYFNYGKFAFDYTGGRTEAEFVSFITDPQPPPPPPPPPKPWSEEAPEVSHLSSTTFDQHLSSHDHTLVMFYAPWCGHCKRAKPEVASAARQLAGTGVTLAGVDCTEWPDVCSKFDVSGYPTFRYFAKGDTTGEKYSGGRTATDFVAYLERKSGLAHEEL